MLGSRLYEGVLRSVVGRGSGVLVHVVLVGVQTGPWIVLWSPGLRVGGDTWLQPPCWGPPSVMGPLPGGVGGLLTQGAAWRSPWLHPRGLLSPSCFLQGRCSVHLGSALYFLANAGFVILKKNGATPMSD